jgi:uncharacterized protein (DUF1330 family)
MAACARGIGGIQWTGEVDMPAYMVVESKVKDRTRYQEYISRVPETLIRYGGRYLSRSSRVIPLSADWKPERMILLEFPGERNIRDWLGSPEYQSIAPLREAGAESRAVILEGTVD